MACRWELDRAGTIEAANKSSSSSGRGRRAVVTRRSQRKSSRTQYLVSGTMPPPPGPLHYARIVPTAAPAPHGTRILTTNWAPTPVAYPNTELRYLCFAYKHARSWNCFHSLFAFHTSKHSLNKKFTTKSNMVPDKDTMRITHVHYSSSERKLPALRCLLDELRWSITMNRVSMHQGDRNIKLAF